MKRFNRIAAHCMIGMCVAAFGGCRLGTVNGQPASGTTSSDFCKRLDCYLNEVKGVFGDKALAKDFVPGGPLTTREYNSRYEIVYADRERTFFSYRAESFSFTGGAHGETTVSVGTVDVKSGKKLDVARVIPADKRAEALAKVKNAVIAKIGGKDNLLGEVTLTENFYIAGDGLHFVFNEYEVASHAQGLVEVVIPSYCN